MTSKDGLSKLKLKQPPATGQESYQYLSSVWQQENMRNSKDFLRWYNNKDVVSTLEGTEKVVDFYHNKGIDNLKLGYTLPTTANLYPFTESDNDLLEKIREDMVGGPSIVFTRKAAVDETFIRDSTNLCKSNVEIDASQLYHFSLCQARPTGLYTKWELDSEAGKIKPRQNET